MRFEMHLRLHSFGRQSVVIDGCTINLVQLQQRADFGTDQRSRVLRSQRELGFGLANFFGIRIRKLVFFYTM